jgi:hypothetical protein
MTLGADKELRSKRVHNLRRAEVIRGTGKAAQMPAEHATRIAVATRAFSAEGVAGASGDFHLILRPAGNTDRVSLVVGDVAGKGLKAASLASRIGHLFPRLDPLRDAGRAMVSLNRELVEHTPAESFASMVLAEVHTATGVLRIWAAGHPPALIWRAATGSVREGVVGGLPLGCFPGFPGWEGEAEEWRWGVGDVLLLYSDGLTETRNDEDEIAGALLEAARAWRPLTDDTTLMVCKRERPPRRFCPRRRPTAPDGASLAHRRQWDDDPAHPLSSSVLPRYRAAHAGQ